MRSDYLKSLGVSGIRLNSIFPSPHYPDDYDNLTSLLEVSKVLGKEDDIQQLSQSLHERNMYLLLDLPLYPYMKQLGKSDGATMVNTLASTSPNASEETSTTTTARPMITVNLITEALQHWIKYGVDGFYIKGLEYFSDLEDIAYHMAEWKDILGGNRALIISDEILQKLSQAQRSLILAHVDLVDVALNVFNGTVHLEDRINKALTSDMAPADTGVWIHWSLGGVDRPRLSGGAFSSNFSMTATLMQLMLPGTPNIFYGDEIGLKAVNDHLNEHNETKHLHHLSTMEWPPNSTQQFTNSKTLPWLPRSETPNFDGFTVVTRMIELRSRSPSLYKNAICKAETVLPNTSIKRSGDDILIIERLYPRRNAFASVSNLGQIRVTLDMSSKFYSGNVMLYGKSEKIYFSDFQIGPVESIIIRLDK